jgi:Fe2+ or Zn2+ uptake regulation protein
MRAGKDVVRVTASRLNVAGLLNKNGGRFSLKALS